jgi:hypothetical protein
MVGSIRANRTLPDIPSRTPPMWMHRGVGTIMGRGLASTGSPLARPSVPWRACALRLPMSGTPTPSAPRTRLPPRPRRLLHGSEWYQKGFGLHQQRIMVLTFYLQIARKREPTSGLEPLTCSLRVIRHVLRGIARACKTRISKGFSLLCLAECCAVLRSGWCQSGVNWHRNGVESLPGPRSPVYEFPLDRRDERFGQGVS